MLGSIVEVDLVGTDAEASDDNEVLCLAEDTLAQLRLGSDSDDMDITILHKSVTHLSGFEEGSSERGRTESSRSIDLLGEKISMIRPGILGQKEYPSHSGSHSPAIGS